MRKLFGIRYTKTKRFEYYGMYKETMETGGRFFQGVSFDASQAYFHTTNEVRVYTNAMRLVKSHE